MENIEQYYARVFAGYDGARVLEHLRAITIERTLGADASDAQLRWVESQRALVRQIEHLIQRGGSCKNNKPE